MFKPISLIFLIRPQKYYKKKERKETKSALILTGRVGVQVAQDISATAPPDLVGFSSRLWDFQTRSRFGFLGSGYPSIMLGVVLCLLTRHHHRYLFIANLVIGIADCATIGKKDEQSLGSCQRSASHPPLLLCPDHHLTQ